MDSCRAKGFMQYALTAGVLFLAVGLCACRVKADKDAEGHDKNVQVDTPLGNVHVNTDSTSATDLGLPVYPGAAQIADKDGNRSADVNLGFGEWQLRVKVVRYSSRDAQDRVVAFYKKALSRYGDVLVCSNHQAQGTPTVTREGLTCAEDGTNEKVEIDHQELELKAGSRKHQHIVGFEMPGEGARTQFALIALDLPVSSVKGKETN